MSETEITMSEKETPIIHISGTLTLKNYMAAVRAGGLRSMLIILVIILPGSFLCTLLISLPDWIPYLKDGRATLGEWLTTYWKATVNGSSIFVLLGFLILYALYLLLIRPYLAGKRMRERHPDGLPIDYDFFEEMLVINSSSQLADQTIRMKYGDVRRRIRENGHIFKLSTGQRNRLGLYKAIMTGDEIRSVRALLKERCPQHK